MASLSTLYESGPTWETFPTYRLYPLENQGEHHEPKHPWIRGSPFLLAMYSQTSILKGKSVKIMSFWN
jgi:hypothetical protein